MADLASNPDGKKLAKYVLNDDELRLLNDERVSAMITEEFLAITNELNARLPEVGRTASDCGPKSDETIPPKLPTYLLYLLLPLRDRQIIKRELEEQYAEVLNKFGKKHAAFFYYTRVAANVLYCSRGAIKGLLKIAGSSAVIAGLKKLGILNKLSHLLRLN